MSLTDKTGSDRLVAMSRHASSRATRSSGPRRTACRPGRRGGAGPADAPAASGWAARSVHCQSCGAEAPRTRCRVRRSARRSRTPRPPEATAAGRDRRSARPGASSAASRASRLTVCTRSGVRRRASRRRRPTLTQAPPAEARRCGLRCAAASNSARLRQPSPCRRRARPDSGRALTAGERGARRGSRHRPAAGRPVRPHRHAASRSAELGPGSVIDLGRAPEDRSICWWAIASSRAAKSWWSAGTTACAITDLVSPVDRAGVGGRMLIMYLIAAGGRGRSPSAGASWRVARALGHRGRGSRSGCRLSRTRWRC